MLASKKVLAVLAILSLTACGESKPIRLQLPQQQRVGLRAEAHGCWHITEDTSVKPRQFAWWLPVRVRLDTTVARTASGEGQRTARRLNTLGRAILRDSEGFELVDGWTADSLTDLIVISLDNRLYGSAMVFMLPQDSLVMEMRGEGQEYGDVSPPPRVPIVRLVATRVACAQR